MVKVVDEDTVLGSVRLMQVCSRICGVGDVIYIVWGLT